MTTCETIQTQTTNTEISIVYIHIHECTYVCVIKVIQEKEANKLRVRQWVMESVIGRKESGGLM